MGDLYDDGVYEEFAEILRNDDKERFLALISEYSDTLGMDVVEKVAKFHARKCLLAMIQGDGCKAAHVLYAKQIDYNFLYTPLACVVSNFPEAYDIVELLLKQGPPEHANTKCVMNHRSDNTASCPLDLLLVLLSYESHIYSWTNGESLYKLIILLCQWKTNSWLPTARLLLPYTDGINNIALTYVKEGRLSSLAALLLVARQYVFVPFDSGIHFLPPFFYHFLFAITCLRSTTFYGVLVFSTVGHIGLTIRQCISNMLDALSSEGDLDHEGARYQSMLLDAWKLFDIFEIAGDALNLYCCSMHEYVSPDKVLFDVVSVFKKSGFVLQPRDIDLRDSLRKCPEIYNAGLFKLADPRTANHNSFSLPVSTRGQGLGATHSNYFSAGECQLLGKFKSGRMLNLVSSASMPRLLSSAAGHINDNHSRVSSKYLAYIAFRLKRGIKF